MRWAWRVAREPLLHFVVVGLLATVVVHYWGAATDRYTIRLGAPERQRLAARYVQQFGTSPSASQLEELSQRYVREEIFFREATSLHLEQNDEIVRRRLLQKYEFLQSDLSAAEEPSDEMLRHWFDAHRQRYLIPARVGFKQLYFSADRDGPDEARARAVRVLEHLHSGLVAHADPRQDAFPGPAQVDDLTPSDAARLFGESELCERAFELPIGQWSGPYRSGYGWHLVLVTRRSPAAMPDLNAIREQVRADYLEAQRDVMNQRNYALLKSSYRIVDGAAR